MSKERNFKGVWIHKKVWLNTELSWMEKLFLVEIDSLDNEEHCYASNAYFSEFFQVSKPRCSQIIKSLESKDYLKIILHKKGKQVLKRTLIINKIKYANQPIKKLKEGSKNTKEGGKNIKQGSKNTKCNIVIQDNNTVNELKEKKETQILNYTELSKKPNAPILTKALAKFEQHFNLYGLSEQPKEIENVRSMLTSIQTNLKAYNKRNGIFDKVSNSEVIEAFNLSIDNFMSKNPSSNKLTLAYFKGSLNPNTYNKHLISKFKQSNKANESNISIVQADLSDFKQIVTQTFKHYKNFAKNECKHIESMMQKLKTEFQKDNIVFEFDYIFKNLPAWIMKTTSYQSLSFIDKKFDELIRESDLRPENHKDYNVLKSSYGHNRAVEVIRLSKLQTT